MRFKDVFSIIGPAMVGPSSSHTAGAVRIGRVARRLLGELPEQAEITLYGSFAETYRGHGTDLALIAGLLDYETDDPRIPQSKVTATALNMDIRFKMGKGLPPHPNTAELQVRAGDRFTSVTGVSIGGGNIEIRRVDGFDVTFSAHYPTLVLLHRDQTGMLADVTQLFKAEGLNIGHMDVDRTERNGRAMTVIETDTSPDAGLLEQLRALPHMEQVRLIDWNGGQP